MKPLQKLKDTLLLLSRFPMGAFASIGAKVVIEHPHFECSDTEVNAAAYQAKRLLAL